tara:strand:- start:113 stop:763 length:651 start_codon:yes stop_codon:yes gene_type:complete
MTASMRFTAFDFDASRYEAMLSDVNNLDNDRLTAISGLIGARAIRTQENRMMVMSNYSSMEALDAANDAHRSIFADIGQYMTGQPLVRSGEVVGIVDGNTPVNDMGYVRFVRASIDDSKWDAIQSYMDDNLASAFDGVAGLSRIRIARLREGSSEGKPAILAAAGYDNEASAQAALPTAQKALAGIAEYVTDEPLIRQGELVWQFRSAESHRLENK